MDRATRKLMHTKQDSLTLSGTPSLSTMLDGQIAVGSASGEQLSIYAKNKGQLWKTSMSSDGNMYVDGNLSVKGNVTGMIPYIYFANIDSNSTSEVFIPFNTTTDTTTMDYRYKNMMPYDGYLSKIMFRAQADTGSTVLKFYKASDATTDPSASGDAVTVDPSSRDTATTAVFGPKYSFVAGNIVSLSVNATNSPQGDMNFAVVFKFKVG